MKKVLFTAAHSGFALQRIPLGGGAAICEHLRDEWSRTKPFDSDILGPEILGAQAPHDKDLVRYSELQYARFCTQFENKLTDIIQKHNPRQTVILSNDVSEGPNFEALSKAGYPIVTIYHVDVVDYFTTIYLRSKIAPAQTTALYRQVLRFGLSGCVPRVLKLIWDKQEASVRYSRGLVVPSARMKEILLSCYPDTDPGRIHVLPWGSWDNPTAPTEVEKEKRVLQADYPSSKEAWRLLTLSRISPEKGQDLLLQALALWEKEADYPEVGVTLYVAGETAFMMGKKFEKRLKNLAAQLTKSQVHFVGFAAGARKRALFETADLYVFPSRHESYGLTLMEALRNAKPVLSTPTHGAREVFKPEFGMMIDQGPENQTPYKLMLALRKLWKDRATLKSCGEKASSWAKSHDFSATASKLADLVASQ